MIKNEEDNSYFFEISDCKYCNLLVHNNFDRTPILEISKSGEYWIENGKLTVKS